MRVCERAEVNMCVAIEGRLRQNMCSCKVVRREEGPQTVGDREVGAQGIQDDDPLRFSKCGKVGRDGLSLGPILQEGDARPRSQHRGLQAGSQLLHICQCSAFTTPKGRPANVRTGHTGD